MSGYRAVRSGGGRGGGSTVTGTSSGSGPDVRASTDVVVCYSFLWRLLHCPVAGSVPPMHSTASHCPPNIRLSR